MFCLCMKDFWDIFKKKVSWTEYDSYTSKIYHELYEGFAANAVYCADHPFTSWVCCVFIGVVSGFFIKVLCFHIAQTNIFNLKTIYDDMKQNSLVFKYAKTFYLFMHDLYVKFINWINKHL